MGSWVLAMSRRQSRSYVRNDAGWAAVLSLALTVSALVGLGTGCRSQAVARFRSPSHRCEVGVGYSPTFGHAEIDLTCGSRTTPVFRSINDAVITFVDVYWSSDESRFATLIAGSSKWTIAYDLNRRQTVPFEPMRHDLERKICADYKLSECRDPLDWAWSPEGQSAFFGGLKGDRR